MFYCEKQKVREELYLEGDGNFRGREVQHVASLCLGSNRVSESKGNRWKSFII